MKWRFFAGCTLAATAISPIANAQLSNGSFNYNRVNNISYYNGAEVDAQEDTYFCSEPVSGC